MNKGRKLARNCTNDLISKITDNEIKINVVNWWCFKHNIPKTRLINPLTHKIAPIISKSLMVR